MELRVALALLAACSGGKAKAVEDAKPRPIDAAPVAPAVLHGYRVDAAAKLGDVKVTVEWKDTPQALRAPGPATKCGTPRVPAVVPSTLWGVADVLVVVDVDHGKAFEPPSARIALEGCDFAPRAVVAGSTVLVASAMPAPVSVSIQELARPLAGAPLSSKPRTIYLPITGHEVEAALEPDTVYAVSYGTDDVATVISATSPYVAVTDPSGAATLRGVPVGTHTVRAYLPARNGGDAHTASGTVNVTEGNLAEITLDISR